MRRIVVSLKLRGGSDHLKCVLEGWRAGAIDDSGQRRNVLCRNDNADSRGPLTQVEMRGLVCC